jgi:hypothetical protein
MTPKLRSSSRGRARREVSSTEEAQLKKVDSEKKKIQDQKRKFDQFYKNVSNMVAKPNLPYRSSAPLTKPVELSKRLRMTKATPSVNASPRAATHHKTLRSYSSSSLATSSVDSAKSSTTGLVQPKAFNFETQKLAAKRQQSKAGTQVDASTTSENPNIFPGNKTLAEKVMEYSSGMPDRFKTKPTERPPSQNQVRDVGVFVIIIVAPNQPLVCFRTWQL